MSQQKLNILVVDDKRIIGDLFEFTLGSKGHAIRWVNTAQGAAEAVLDQKFDIAFIDIVMPERDGVTILEDMKRAAVSMPIVMMSGYSVGEKRQRAHELGAAACLQKPFEMSEVEEIIKKCLSISV